MVFGLRKRKATSQLDQFEHLVKNSESTLFRSAYRLTGNLDDARDLLQDALIEAYKAFPNFKPNGHFDRWVIRIMTNTYIDGCRRRAVRPQTIGLTDLSKFGDENSEIDLPDNGVLPEDAVLASEFRSLLEQSLQKLPPEYRTAMVLCDMEGFTYAEAAVAMNCPEGTVRSRLHRARLAMRQYLEPYLLIDSHNEHANTAPAYKERMK